MGFCINPASKRLSDTRSNGGTHQATDAGANSSPRLSPGPATSGRTSPRRRHRRRSAATAVNQSVLPSPSSLEPYLASHSACCARSQRRSSCHSGYIHPGNRTGTNPNTPTTNDTNTNVVRNDLTGLFSSTPTGSTNPNSPPNRKHNPTAGSITAMVLRPRLKTPDSPSRARSPQTLSENIANHQKESVNPPRKMQVIPITMSLNTAVHPKNNIISATRSRTSPRRRRPGNTEGLLLSASLTVALVVGTVLRFPLSLLRTTPTPLLMPLRIHPPRQPHRNQPQHPHHQRHQASKKKQIRKETIFPTSSISQQAAPPE